MILVRNKNKNRIANRIYPDEIAYYEPSNLDLKFSKNLFWFAGLKGLNFNLPTISNGREQVNTTQIIVHRK